MKKAILTSVSILTVVALIATGVALAYFFQNDTGWEQDISSTSIVFQINGQNVNTVTNEELRILARGEHSPLQLAVSVTSNVDVSSVARFAVDFSLTGIDNDLARAVEVYLYKNGNYEFVSMLDSFSGFSGIMAVNTQRIYDYRLIYSESAGSFYEGKGFTLNVNGTSEIVAQEGDEYFVSSYETLYDAVEAGSAMAGKTIVLTSDVTLPSAATSGISNYLFSSKVGIDLAGHTLTIPDGVTVGVDYDTYNSAYSALGIYSNAASGGAIVVSGSGKFEINTPNDFMYIQDSLFDSFSAITVRDFSLAAVTDAYASKVAELRRGLAEINGSYDFTQNLKFYTSMAVPGGLRLSLALGADATAVFETDAAGVYSISPLYDVPVTTTYDFIVSVGQNGESRTFALIATVKGVSAAAVAESVIAAVPDTVQGSLFLPAYDVATRSTITWITDNSELLSAAGEYLKDGLDGLTNWTAKTVKLGVIVETFGVRSYAEKSVAVSVLTAAERTERIYNHQQMVVESEQSTIGFFDNYIDSALATKAGLTGIDIAIVSGNLSASGNNYLEVVADSHGFDDIRYANKPNVDRSVKITVTITFTYTDGVTISTFAVNKTVIAVGSQATTDPTDITQFLREEFLVNDYTEGTAYSFTVSGNTSTGVKIEYAVPAANSSYIVVENGLYIAAADGEYLKSGDDYLFFGTRKTLVSGEYIEAEDGAFIVANDVAYDYATQVAAGNIYKRQSRITVLPANVPSVENTEVIVSARLYSTVDENGLPVYETDTDGSELIYSLSLAVKGIYHNAPDEIADYNLYGFLRSVYDLDANGWIEVTEAKTSWLNATVASKLSSVTRYSVAYKYLELSGRSIDSLKGLEYFTGIEGIRFANSVLTDFSAIEELPLIKYIDVANNGIADISQLAYRDNLEVLIMATNAVSDLSPLKNLPSVRYLDISYNPGVTDFSALSSYSKLKYLDIRQSNGTYTNTQNCTYVLSLIAGNSTGVTIRRLATESTAWSSSLDLPDFIVAAKALSQLVEINSVYNTLYIPTTYTYKYAVGATSYNKTYKLTWDTQGVDDSQYLIFNTVGDTTSGYTIVTPIVARAMTISVNVWENGAVTASMSRLCTLTLLPSEDVADAAYIQIGPSEVRLATDVVPDKNLLALLFGTFNTTSNGTVTIGASTYQQSNILTATELSSVAALSIDWSNKGIGDLTGLRYFAAAFAGVSLNLGGNTMKNADGEADISELSYLDGLLGLTLSGQTYDFGQLLTTPESGTGLTTLTRLSVYGCYGLENESVLAGLYRAYLQNTSSNIYKDDAATTIWDPYAAILAKYSQNIPSLFSFVNLNESGSYYSGDNHYFVFNFYGVQDITFRLTAPESNAFTGYQASTFFVNLTETVDGTTYVNGIQYVSLAASTTTSFAEINLTGHDGRASIIAPHYVELIAEQNYNIVIVDYISSRVESGLEDVFPGRSLRSYVLSSIVSNVFSRAPVASYDLIGDGYYKLGNTYYISMATIAALPYTFRLVIDGVYTSSSNALEGLQYLSATKAAVSRDAKLGDGSYLVNLTELYLENSSVDFTGLSATPLSNMLSLQIGKSSTGSVSSNRYCNAYKDTEYFLDRFPNLTDFSLLNSLVYDWEGLRGLVGAPIANFTIYATSDSSSNANNNTGATAALVKQIYDASTATTKVYRIGSPSLATDSSYAYNGTWAEASGLSYLTVNNEKEYQEFSGVIEDFGLRIDGEYFSTSLSKEPTTSIYFPKSTFDVGYGTTYDVLNADSSLNTNAASYSTRDFAIQYYFYGASTEQLNSLFGLSGDAALPSPVYNTRRTFLRDIPIVIMNQAKMQAIIDSGLASVTVESDVNGRQKGITITLQQHQYDIFFAIEARIGYGYYSGYDGDGNYIGNTYNDFTANQTPIGILYPMFINGTVADVDPMATNTMSYGVFEDISLRMIMLIVSGRILQYPASDYTYKYGALNTEAVKDITALVWNTTQIKVSGIHRGGTNPSETIINLDALLADNTTNVPYCSTASYSSNLYSLGGISALESLRTITLNGQYLTEVNELFLLHNLVSVNLSNNLISDISGIASYTSSGDYHLTTLNLSNNVLKTTYTTAGTVNTTMFDYVLGDGLTTLNLANNESLDDNDLKAIADSGANTLSSINFYNTQSTYSVRGLEYASQVLTNSSAAQVNIALNNATGVNYTAAAFAELYNLCTATADNLTIYNYITNGFDSNDALSSFVIGDSTYTITCVDGNFWAVREFLYSTTTVLQIASNTDTQFVIRFDAPFTFVNGTDYQVKIGDTIISRSEIADPAIWTWLIRNGTSSTSGNYRVANTLYEISIVGNNGIKSLKGLDKIPGLRTIKISNNVVTELWDAQMPSSFTTAWVRDARISAAQVSAALALAPNVTTLDLERTLGIDYLEDLGAGVCLADQIVERNNINKIYINNIYNTDFAIKDVLTNQRNVFSAAVGAMRSYDTYMKFLGVAESSAFSSGSAIVSDINCFNGVADRVFVRVNQAALAVLLYNAESRPFYVKRTLATGATSTTTNAAQVALDTAYNFTLDMSKKVFNTTTSKSREIIPSSIYQNDIESGDGVVFYLPQYVMWYDAQNRFSTVVTTANGSGSNYVKTPYLDSATYTFTDGATYSSGTNYAQDSAKVYFNSGNWTSAITALRLYYRLIMDTTTFSYSYIQFSVQLSQEKVNSNRQPQFYIEMSDSAGADLVRAESVFSSNNLVDWLFSSSTGLAASAFAAAADGWYITYAGRMATTSLNLPHKGITSLDGLELFPNLTNLSVTLSAIVEINALALLHLTSFTYTNSNSQADNYYINDFYPLLKGSRDTLTTFVYQANPNLEICDLSILMSFGAQLQTIRLYQTATANNLPNIYTYLESPSFLYMLSWFYKNRPSTRFLVNQRVVTSCPYEMFSGMKRLLPKKEYTNASEILAKIDFASEATLSGNVCIAPTTEGWEENSQKITLPAMINDGGRYYAIDWRKASSAVSDQTITASGSGSYLLGDGTTFAVSNGMSLTYAELKALMDSIGFVSDVVRGIVGVRTSVLLSNVEKLRPGIVRLSACIEVEGYVYERMFNILADYGALLAKEFDAKYRLYSTLYATDWSDLLSVYSTAISDIAAADGRNDEAYSLYRDALYDLAALVAGDVTVTYYGETSSTILYAERQPENATITLRSAEPGFISWIIDGTIYAFGSSYTLTGRDLSIYGNNQELSYLLVKNSATTLPTDYVVKFSKVNSTTHVAHNFQVAPASAATNDRVMSDIRYVGETYKVVDCIDVTNVLATIVLSEVGNFDITLDLSGATPTLTTSQNDYYYSAMGKLNTSTTWTKPDHRFQLSWDEDLRLFYLESYNSGTAGTATELKLVAVNNSVLAGATYLQYSNAGWNSFAISGAGVPATGGNISFSAAARTANTIYFDPSASCYNFAATDVVTCFGYSSSVGFATPVISPAQAAEGISELYSAQGIIILTGSYSETKNIAATAAGRW